MKRLIIQAVSLFLFTSVFSQQTNPYQKGVTAEKNLSAIFNVSPYTPGGVGFDTRYQGVKGTPRLFDTLQPALVWINRDTNYYLINADLDVYQNRLIFRHPKTNNLMSIPSGIVNEVIFTIGNRKVKFKSVQTEKFERDAKKEKFYQVMNEKLLFIRIPLKIFNEADYKNLYGPDRRFDEFDLQYQYYYMDRDSIFHKIIPNQRTLSKLFPDYKTLIESVVEEKKYSNNDEMVARILENIGDNSNK
jgi:hypothetical protein